MRRIIEYKYRESYRDYLLFDLRYNYLGDIVLVDMLCCFEINF